MRTVTYGAACSLDGYIAAADGGIDWLQYSKDVQTIMAGFWKTVDTILFGRRTLEDAIKRSGGAGDSRLSGITSYVFSRTLTQSPDPSVQLVRDDAGAFVRDMKTRPGKGICVMSGGDFARSLFEAEVIDEVGLNVHPVLLGSGTPLFAPMDRRVTLTLAECRALEGGCAYLTYRVAPSSP